MPDPHASFWLTAPREHFTQQCVTRFLEEEERQAKKRPVDVSMRNTHRRQRVAAQMSVMAMRRGLSLVEAR
jgi:hypothetical protein